MELPMDNMTKKDDKHIKMSSPLVLESWPNVTGNRCKTQEMEGDGKGTNVAAGAYNEERKWSMMVHNEAQARWVNFKGVLLDVIMTSNSKEDTSAKIEQIVVNSNARAYHERG